MASPGRPKGWDELPDEILLYIFSYLEPADIARLQHVSRRLRKLGLDNELWKRHCFHTSPWYRTLLRRRAMANASTALSVLEASGSAAAVAAAAPMTTTMTTTTVVTAAATTTMPTVLVNPAATTATTNNGAAANATTHAAAANAATTANATHTATPTAMNHATTNATTTTTTTTENANASATVPNPYPQNGGPHADDLVRPILDSEPAMPPRWRELQDLTNWDPSFPTERVSWYDEYIQRRVPPSINWLEAPRIRDRGCSAMIEARGMDLYHPYDGHDGLGTMLAVSPLDDGSVCLWDVNGTRTKAGAILFKSKKDILFADGPGSQNFRRSKRVDTGVTECVRVDNHAHRAYFAIQSNLFEIDLERLDVVSRETFEWSISTLSPVSPGVPLTVGTSLGIHLHDFRARARPRTRDATEKVDGPACEEMNPFRAIFDPRPLPPYAPLSQPTPLSIVHLPEPGPYSLVSHDIYVSGRFTSILHYDRRKFPNIAGSIHSGATINSMVALPHPFSAVDSELRRTGELTAEQVGRSKEAGRGRTLIAGGIYKSKGSLEIYGLSPCTEPLQHGGEEMKRDSACKNRQAAASSSILSVTNHGTKIAFSDGSGQIRWFERDGTTEIGSISIGNCGTDGATSLFASMAVGELARKIVSTRSHRSTHIAVVAEEEGGDDDERMNDDNIIFWTGERLGLVTFTPRPRFVAEDFDEPADAETRVTEEDGQRYAERMRGALQHQADEARFMTSFGASY